MTRCLYCGAELRPNSRYCLECGQLAESAVPPAAAAPAGLLAGPPAASVPAASVPAAAVPAPSVPTVAPPAASVPAPPARPTPPAPAPPAPAPPAPVSGGATVGTAPGGAAPLGIGDVPRASVPDEGPVAPGGPAPGVLASSEDGLVDGSTVLRAPAAASRPDDEPVAVTRRSLRRREQLAAEQAAGRGPGEGERPIASVPDEITGAAPAPAPRADTTADPSSPSSSPAAAAPGASSSVPDRDEGGVPVDGPGVGPVPAARPVPTAGAVPSVGAVLLTFSTGELVTVAGSAVVGRAPQEAARNAGSQAVAVDDPTRSVSRVHLFVDVADGRALVRDAGSGNGSQLERDGLRRTLPEATGTELVAGDRIWIGDVSVDVATAS